MNDDELKALFEKHTKKSTALSTVSFKCELFTFYLLMFYMYSPTISGQVTQCGEDLAGFTLIPMIQQIKRESTIKHISVFLFTLLCTQLRR